MTRKWVVARACHERGVSDDYRLSAWSLKTYWSPKMSRNWDTAEVLIELRHAWWHIRTEGLLKCHVTRPHKPFRTTSSDLHSTTGFQSQCPVKRYARTHLDTRWLQQIGPQQKHSPGTIFLQVQWPSRFRGQRLRSESTSLTRRVFLHMPLEIIQGLPAYQI